MSKQWLRFRPRRAVAVIGLLLAVPAAAGDGLVEIPPQPEAPVAAKAYRALETICAGCHQEGRRRPGRSGGDFANVLALDEIARDPDRVRPGAPDASRIFQILVRRHAPLTADAGDGWASSADVRAVREWIAELPPDRGCAGQSPILAAEAMAAIASALADTEPEARRSLRFISLVELYNACATPRELTVHRATIAQILGVLAKSRGLRRWRTIGPRDMLIAFSLDDLGWASGEWRQLAERVPASAWLGGAQSSAIAGLAISEAPVLRADGLAMALVDSRWSGMTAADVVSAGPRLHGLDPLAALARHYRRGGDLETAAGETGREVSELAGLLERVAGPDEAAARSLLHGWLARPELDRVLAVAMGVGLSAPSAAPVAAPVLRLWPDARVYRPGDSVTINAEATADCHLTLISIDGKGAATVIFPNDLAVDGRLTAGQRLTVPADGAPYRFRVREPGREGLVGLCAESAQPLRGIEHDFERQRFTVIGNWAEFLAESVEEASAEPVPASPPPRRRGRRSAEARDKPPASIPAQPLWAPLAWAAATYDVRP